MICSKDNTGELNEVSTGLEAKYLAGGSTICVLDEFVVKIDLLADRLIHWLVG